jgi:hypothetical protein
MVRLFLNSAVLLSLVAVQSDAFSTRSRASLSQTTFVGKTARFMSSDEEPEKTISIKSGKKEIAYDEKTGRFFETDQEPVECIPDDEYCVVDQKTGELIRLTMEEKERIFLDSLQVRKFKFLIPVKSKE